MRIVIVSDTHNTCPDVPEGDVFIHCGDATYEGKKTELHKFRDFLNKLPHKHKLFVPGNHEITMDRKHVEYSKYHKMWLPDDLIILQNSEYIINGIKFYGAPFICPINGRWGFEKDLVGQTQTCNQIPRDTQVLITHTPPFGILDEGFYRGYKESFGSTPLRQTLMDLSKLKLHCFGHMHEFGGTFHEEQLCEAGNLVKFVNAAVLDRNYFPCTKAMVVDL